MHRITTKLRQQAVELLESGAVHLVIGHGRGTLRGKCRPVFIDNPSNGDDLIWSPWCAPNLAKYLVEHRCPGHKTAVVVKGCDSRAIVRLLQDNQLTRDELLVIGIPCRGQYDYRKLQGLTGVAAVADVDNDDIVNYSDDKLLLDKCKFCETPTPVLYDLLLGEEIAPEVTSLDQQFEEIARLEALSVEQKSAYWDSLFNRCLRCHACRKVCPACTCRECVFNQYGPDWVSKRNNLSENTAFHLIRAFHVAGRCVDCGECDRVCPVQIPLRLLNRKVLKDIKELYGVATPGIELDATPALGGFSTLDPDKYM